MKDELLEYAEISLVYNRLPATFLPFVTGRSTRELDRRIKTIKNCLDDEVEKKLKEIETNG